MCKPKKNHAMEIHVVENHVRRGIAIGIWQLSNWYPSLWNILSKQ